MESTDLCVCFSAFIELARVHSDPLWPNSAVKPRIVAKRTSLLLSTRLLCSGTELAPVSRLRTPATPPARRSGARRRSRTSARRTRPTPRRAFGRCSSRTVPFRRKWRHFRLWRRRQWRRSSPGLPPRSRGKRASSHLIPLLMGDL